MNQLSALERFNQQRAYSETSFDDNTPILVSQVDAIFPGEGTRIAQRAFECESIGPGDALLLKFFVAGGVSRRQLVRGLQLAVLERLR
jgi:hypothetical protein